MIRLVFILVLLFAPNIALAQWQSTIDDDSLMDDKTAVTVSTSEDGVSLAFKCWAEKLDQTILVVTTASPFDVIASYRGRIQLSLRVDKGEQVQILASPQELSGMLSFVSDSLEWGNVVQAMKAVGDAKKRVALAFGST